MLALAGCGNSAGDLRVGEAAVESAKDEDKATSHVKLLKRESI